MLWLIELNMSEVL